MNKGTVEKNKDEKVIDYSFLSDTMLKDMKNISEMYVRYISLFEGLLETKEIENLDKEKKREMIKDIIYSTEYFLYKLKATLNNPI